MNEFLGGGHVLHVSGIGLERLKVAMSLSSNAQSVGYTIASKSLAFSRYAESSTIPFPSPLSMDRCAELAWDWVQKTEYPPEPDHDGDNERGWECTGISHGGLFLLISPMWIQYGK